MRKWQAIPVAAFVALLVGGALFGVARPVTHAAQTPFELYVDCDPGTAGIQSTCTFPSGTTSVDVDVVLKNNSLDDDLGNFNFEAITNQQPVLNPKDGVDITFNANPDFNNALAGSWTCSPPAPNKDKNADPNIADSFLSCFSLGDGPAIAGGATLTLATVHYATIDGQGSIDLAEVQIANNAGAELISCNPVTDPPLGQAGNCFSANITIGAGGATQTPIPTSTSTARPATNTPISGTPTSLAYSTVTPTASAAVPATDTPAAEAPSPEAPPPGPPPPGGRPSGNVPGGAAGAGGTGPIRLPETGAGQSANDWGVIALIALTAVVAGGAAGGAYFAAAHARVGRRSGRGD